MSWKPETPFVSTDGIVEIYEDDRLLGVVLITRKNPPYGVALPGGFVDVGESVEDALRREMKEEISLDVTITKLLGVYSDPTRDERFHTVSVVYVCKAYSSPIASDDAKSATIIPIESLKTQDLVFDHKKIIEDYLSA